MDIRLVSSLTAEDEVATAPRVLDALCAVLDRMPIAYTARLETTNGLRIAMCGVSDNLTC